MADSSVGTCESINRLRAAKARLQLLEARRSARGRARRRASSVGARSRCQKWQATAWPSPRAERRLFRAQRSRACGQRVWKRQPDGGCERARHVALRARCAARSRAGLGHRDRGQQRLRVGMARLARRARACRPISTILPEVHHRDAVGDVLHHREVVRDEEVGEAQAPLQVLQQVDDLRLDRDVERRHRLVADDELAARRRARARCRCAGAGRRRTRAGSAARARARGRRVRSSSATRSRRASARAARAA